MNKNKKNGFSLLELLLYVAIGSIVLFVIALLIPPIIGARVKNQTIAEVEQQGIQIMHILTQSIRNSDLINAPLFGISSSTLSLRMGESSKNPTIFDTNLNTLRITEGATSPIDITSSRINISDLVFQNLSHNDSSGLIHIQFTLTHNNDGNRNEFDYSKTFTSSASLRFP